MRLNMAIDYCDRLWRLMILIDDGIGHSGDYYKEYDLDVNL